ncbi:unnamed protein product [Mytilus edulis]|uniref:Uncharacterized protein n=1 Tax=Mytilus edulis TaxID=6550 RepID=A0A8S3TMT6_MYTED|nr:unnamed protein product [Mytilus edulis]
MIVSSYHLKTTLTTAFSDEAPLNIVDVLWAPDKYVKIILQSSLLQKIGNDDSLNDPSLSLDNTKIEQSTTGKNLQNENNLSDTSLTFAKTLANVNNSSTPIRKEGTKNKTKDNQVETPKEKIAKHGQMLSSKLDTLTATLTTIDISFKLFVNKLTDLKNAPETIAPEGEQKPVPLS